MRDIIVFSGSSNTALSERICKHLGLPLAKVELKKFANGETSVQFMDSVREKDVFIIQSAGSESVNDNLIQLLIMISACKMASSKRISVVCPYFFYSRQTESPSSKRGVPSLLSNNKSLACDSFPPSPRPMSRTGTVSAGSTGPVGERDLKSPLSAPTLTTSSSLSPPTSTNTILSPSPLNPLVSRLQSASAAQQQLPLLQPIGYKPHSQHAHSKSATGSSHNNHNTGKVYKSWIAQSGTLIANLLVSAGANHIITMDLHESHYQGFFDIPVDNLYSKSLIQHYIVNYVPDYKDCVIVSPDAGGAKRATAIADTLGLPFALIHKERRYKVSSSHSEHNNHSVNGSNPNNNGLLSPSSPSGCQMSPPSSIANASADDLLITNNSAINSVQLGQCTSTASLNSIMSTGMTPSGEKVVATTMLVGHVKDKTCVIIDDLIDTANTVVRASKLLKEQGAKLVYVITTHGIFSGEALKKVRVCGAIDKIITTNTIDQQDHYVDFVTHGGSFETLDVSKIFAEAIRRINNGESVSIIYDQGW
ncbi:unnamed protein product [Ambrosiozyma monospora]|uniref:ribose-phosphate diphosphokinase n=1 Tax=Ambrosiozyma monospora TaxID=43982 RepID=A0A9W6YN10_AMBMO|nr:unnamed protein product [Ambrosiozyma monospora]